MNDDGRADLEPNTRRPRFRKRGSGRIFPPQKRPLSALSRLTSGKDDKDNVLSEVGGTNDRTTCLILSSMIERQLEQLLFERIRFGSPIDSSWKPKIFSRDGALSTFFGNIGLARTLRVIDVQTYRDLDRLRQIRNVFAHSALPVNFQTKKIATELRKFHRDDYMDKVGFSRDSFSEEKRIFISKCISIRNTLNVYTGELLAVMENVFTANDQEPPDA